MYIKERKPRKGWEDICERLETKKRDVEEEIRKQFEEECKKIDAVLLEVTEEVDVFYPDPVEENAETVEEVSTENTETQY